MTRRGAEQSILRMVRGVRTRARIKVQWGREELATAPAQAGTQGIAKGGRERPARLGGCPAGHARVALEEAAQVYLKGAVREAVQNIRLEGHHSAVHGMQQSKASTRDAAKAATIRAVRVRKVPPKIKAEVRGAARRWGAQAKLDSKGTRGLDIPVGVRGRRGEGAALQQGHTLGTRRVHLSSSAGTPYPLSLLWCRGHRRRRGHRKVVSQAGTATR